VSSLKADRQADEDPFSRNTTGTLCQIVSSKTEHLEPHVPLRRVQVPFAIRTCADFSAPDDCRVLPSDPLTIHLVKLIAYL
jgi:hypothetical protein